MESKKQTPPKKIELSPEEEAKLKSDRAIQKNLIDAQKEINEILVNRKVNLVVDPNSPFGKPQIILVPVQQ